MFGDAPATIRNWEKTQREFTGMPIEALQKYECYYGIPPSMLLAIAEMSALAIEGKRDKLKALAEFMRKLGENCCNEKELDALVKIAARQQRLVREGHRPTIEDKWNAAIARLVFHAALINADGDARRDLFRDWTALPGGRPKKKN